MSDHYTQYLNRTLDGVHVAGRWSVGRKSALLTLIRRGDMTFEHACGRFNLSAEELASWMKRDKAFGGEGLKVTKLQMVGRTA